jgi:hypothetical protein
MGTQVVRENSTRLRWRDLAGIIVIITLLVLSLVTLVSQNPIRLSTLQGKWYPASRSRDGQSIERVAVTGMPKSLEGSGMAGSQPVR